MKNINIKILNKNYPTKHKVLHTEDGIEVIDKPESEWKDNTTAKAKLIIGNYELTLYISLEKWPLDKYKKQWKEGIERLRTHNESCLVVNVYESIGELRVTKILLYKINNMIHAQLRLFIDEQFEPINDHNYTLETCYNFIPTRKTHEDDGEEISEAITPYE